MEDSDSVVGQVIQVDSESASSSRPTGLRLNSMPDNLSPNMNNTPSSLIATTDQIPSKQSSDPPVVPPVVGDDFDDDVQFMYCAPKSKRKKRKLSETVKPMEEERADSPAGDTSRCSIIKPEQEPRRASAGMIEKFESCHIGPDKDIPISARTGSLPTTVIPTQRISIPKSAQSNPSDLSPKTLAPNPPCPTLLRDVTLPKTWDEPPRSPPCKEWRPICLDGNSPKRQKRDELTGIVATNSANSSHLPQVSPKTIPSSIPNPFRQLSNTPGYIDMLGSSGMQDMRGLTLPNHAMDINWSDFGCGQPMNIDPRHNRLHYNSETMSPDSSSQGKTISSTAPDTHLQRCDTTLSQNSRNNMQAELATSPTCIPQSRNGNPGDVPIPNSPRLWQRQQQSRVSPQSQPALNFGSPTRSNIHLPSNSLPISNKPSFFWRTLHPSPLNQPRIAGRNMLHNSLTRPADILRKPSLYRIPPWPSTSDTSSSEISAGPGVNATRWLVGGNGGLMREQRSQSRFVPVSPSGLFGPTQPRQMENRQDEPPSTTCLNDRDEHFSKSPTIEGLNLDESCKRGRHEHSPNLIIDIAETCQRLFPFSAVAARHDKSIQKVFDTFSAIIQIPLLRNAQDNRRHGSLGKRRMREYREAKKAMERANEEARKERTGRIDRELVGGEGEREKVASRNGSALLKKAVVRNARENTGTI